MDLQNLRRDVTGKEIVSACIAIFVLFGPPGALVIFPSSTIIANLFGGYRLLLFYVVAIGVIAYIERRAIRHVFRKNR